MNFFFLKIKDTFFKRIKFNYFNFIVTHKCIPKSYSKNSKFFLKQKKRNPNSKINDQNNNNIKNSYFFLGPLLLAECV